MTGVPLLPSHHGQGIRQKPDKTIRHKGACLRRHERPQERARHLQSCRSIRLSPLLRIGMRSQQIGSVVSPA